MLLVCRSGQLVSLVHRRVFASTLQILGSKVSLTESHAPRKSEGIVSETTGGRPHIIFNQKTQQYVLWSNLDTGYTVATSSAPDAPFTTVGQAALDPQFAGLQPADETVTTIGKQL